MHIIRRRWMVLAAAVGFLALPNRAPTMPNLPGMVPSVLELPGAQVDAEKHKQALLAAYIASTYRKPFEYAHSIVKVTFDVAKRYSLPPSLLLAIMAKESSFEHRVVSTYGATGLMQVVPRYHLAKLGAGESAKSLQNPGTNIRVGAEILNEYVAQEGTLDRALVKYSGNATRYSSRIHAYWRKLQEVENLPANDIKLTALAP